MENTDPTPTPAATTPAPEASKPNRFQPLRLALIVLAVLVIGAGVYFFFIKSDGSTDTPATSQQSSELTSLPTISVLEEGKLVLPNGYADPTIAKTETGYRMYVNRQSGGPSGYLTFTSTDGQTWTKESSDLVIPQVATGRAVIMDGGIRVYYPGPQPINPTDPPADMFSSFSTDGLSFTRDNGNRLEPRSDAYYVEGPTVFQLPDGSWRMYFNENSIAAGNQRDGQIWGATSTDGLTWTRDKEPTLVFDETEEALGKQAAPWAQVLHPFVIKNPQGGYLMFYNSHSEVFAATSEDGLDWQKLGQIGVHGADVDGYFQEDGSFRMFYGDFSEATGGLVYSAVLKVD